MKTLSERMNMKFGYVSNAFAFSCIGFGILNHETFSNVCHQCDICIDNITDNDFYSASIIFKYFVKSANEETGYIISIWFD